jgi:8-oxo-dGTP pyrophosphatase MutT (NUDIX family)
LQHRVRAAVILVEDDRLLLVKHVDPHSLATWWIPPGGGLEPEDESILACARREVMEETGLRVEIGKLVYLREFAEAAAGVHHIELYFLCGSYQGEITMDNVAGSGPDEDYIRDVAWVPREELAGLIVYPEHLVHAFWDDLGKGFPAVIHLGTSSDAARPAS